MTCRSLPRWRSVLAVVAHPDDESFGLGAVLATLTATSRVAVLCFTHGEASTLHGADPGDLHSIRTAELTAAAAALHLTAVTLLDYPDGSLAGQPAAELADAVVAAAERADATALIVFDPSGVTGHPDHRAATGAAVAAATRLGLPVLAWTLPGEVAEVLNDEFGATFHGHPASAVDIELPVDRSQQLDAIGCHRSQVVAGGVLWRRVELLGSVEHLRWIHRAHDDTTQYETPRPDSPRRGDASST